jgi:hypothetical protein
MMDRRVPMRAAAPRRDGGPTGAVAELQEKAGAAATG